MINKQITGYSFWRMPLFFTAVLRYNQGMKNKGEKAMSDSRIRALALHGIFTAAIAMLTLFASVPLPAGSSGAYLNAGDAAVYAAAWALGPVGGAITAGVGSALADVLHGAVVYAPATLVIKALMGLVCGLLIKRLRLAAPAVAGLIMPAGYFAYEYLIAREAAVLGLWTNLIQYAFGAVAGIVLILALSRAFPKRDGNTIKRSIVTHGKKLISHGLTTGTGGNISCFDRAAGLVYITPTTMPYDEIGEGDIPVYRLDGTPVEKPHEPSMELGMHLNIYRQRPDVNAVVHTHSPALKQMAELDENPFGLPAAPVYPVGSKELAEGCVAHLGDAEAVLLRGHGAVFTGRDIDEAFSRAIGYERKAKALSDKKEG